jgi:hypothetical protein
MNIEKEPMLALVTSGLSLIPITEGQKKPHAILGSNHKLLTQRATASEIQSWLNAGVKSWGVANGAVSKNLVTLDFDEKNYIGLYDLWYAKLDEVQRAFVDTCTRSSTRNKGTHVRYFTESSQPTVKLARIAVAGNIETTAEVRGEGAYALVPPSVGYEFLHGDLGSIPSTTDAMHKELIDVLRTFNEVEDVPATEYEIKTVSGTNRSGDRFNQLATWEEILEPHGWHKDLKDKWVRPGKDLRDGISATTDYDGIPMFYVFSSSAHPFQANKGYSKFNAYTLLNHHGDFKASARDVAKKYPETKDKEETNQVNKLLLADILARPDITLFHDELGDGYILLEIDDHQEILALKSKAVKKLLSGMAWNNQKKPLSGEALKSTIGVLEGKAFFEGAKIKLQNRIAWRDNTLWYDFTNDKYQVLKLNKNNWEIVDTAPIIFKRYSHHKPQVLPIKDGDIKLFLKYVNITNKDHQLLLLVFIVSCFIPDFPHPMLIVFGPQGSSKSTLGKMIGAINDPSVIEIGTIPNNLKDLVQALAHHHFSFFDNLSYISDETSDLLCKAITGGGFTKRELYSDDEDIIYNFMRCIGMNGINLVANRPDLLERSLLLELERIDPSNRKDEGSLYKEFYNDLPSILGGIFDTLVKALQLQPAIPRENLPRMADFAIWGSAIAEALGHTKEEFISAYQINTGRQVEMLLSDNAIATTLFAFMEDKFDWQGTCTELLKELSFSNVDTYEKHWPKGAGALSRKLNELRTPLKQMGYEVTITTSGTARSVRIQKTVNTGLLENIPVQGMLMADDTDDVS